MSQSLVLDVKGLHTYSSEISGVPPGSLAIAENVNINRLNIIEPRRGFNFLDYDLPSPTDRTKKLIFWDGSVFAHYGSTFAYYNPAAGFQSRGSLLAPAKAIAVKDVSFINKNLYLTSSEGLKKTDGIGTSLYPAGVPKGLTIDFGAPIAAGRAVAAGKFVTYRYLIARKDANSNFVYGGVSGRFTFQNTLTGDANVSLTCYIPSGLNETYFLQLYRGGEYTSPATNDELQLVYETPLSTSNISQKTVAITDIVPLSLLKGATIYTAPSQQGIASDNTVPPLAADIAQYKNCLWFADVESKQRFSFSLVSVNAPGLVAGDTITVTMMVGATTVTEVYQAAAAYDENSTPPKFKLSALSSVALAIDETVKSLIKLINKKSALVYAFSMSQSDDDLPGKVLLEARSLGSNAFTVTSTNAAAYQPQLPATANVNNTSANDAYKNGLMFSKSGQPEHVPLKNLLFVGSADDRIKRIIGLRDGLFIFKERDGCYVLRGENESSFNVSLLDNTAKLVAPESIVTVNNLVYGLFEAGICQISDSGVSIISMPIKDQLLPLYAETLELLKTLSFGISADTDGKYILSVPTAIVNGNSVKQYIYDVFGNSFCSWNLSLTAGGVNPADNKLYIGPASQRVQVERKNYDFTDYGDFGSLCTISAYNGAALTITNYQTMAPGDILYQSGGSNPFAYINAIDTVNNQVMIDSAQTWVLNAQTVVHIKAIDVKVQWNADFAGNPAGLKHYYELSLIQNQSFQKSATVWFSSDINPSENAIEIEASSGNGTWGSFTFGDQEIWGGEQAKSPRRLGIPRPQARCNQLTVRFEHKVAYSDFELTGIAFTYNPTSTRTSR